MIRTESFIIFSSEQSLCLTATPITASVLSLLTSSSKSCVSTQQRSLLPGGDKHTRSGLGSKELGLNGFKEFRRINKQAQRLNVKLNRGQLKLIYSSHYQFPNK